MDILNSPKVQKLLYEEMLISGYGRHYIYSAGTTFILGASIKLKKLDIVEAHD